MKKKSFLAISVFAFICMSLHLCGQENQSCKVLVAEISEKYEGGCKNGLAHGKGKASGVDIYEGRFKKGLPHGKGKYTWSNGNYYDGSWKAGKRDGKGFSYESKLDKKTYGEWDDDKFVKEVELRPYTVLQRIGVTGYNFHEKQNVSSGSIEIVFARDGVERKRVQDLQIDASSGFVKMSDRFSGVDNVIYPVEIKVEFTAPNRFKTATINYEFKFKIEKESSWKVVLRY